MRPQDPDWDKKSTDDLARIAAVNAWANGKVLKEIKTMLAVLLLAIGWIAYRLVNGSWI